jgi:hypothetical protein
MAEPLTLAARRGRERLILKDAGLTAAEVRALMALASHANAEGLAWPSQRTLRRQYHVGGRVIRTALAKGVRRGHFAPAGAGPSGVRRWRLMPPNGDPGAPTAGAPAGPGCAHPGPGARPSGPQGAPIQAPRCAHGGRRRVKEEIYEQESEEGRAGGRLPGRAPPAGEEELGGSVLSLLFKGAPTNRQKETTLDTLDRLLLSGVPADFIRRRLPDCLAAGAEKPWQALDAVGRAWKAHRAAHDRAEAERRYHQEQRRKEAQADQEALERLAPGPYRDLYLKVRDGAKVRAQHRDRPDLAGLIVCRCGELKVCHEKTHLHTSLAKPDLAAGLWILDPPPADVRSGPQSGSAGADRITVASGRPDPILGRP